jgi:replicative DNA helicase
LVTLSEHLKNEGLIDKCGGAAYLAELTDGVPIGVSLAVSEYARIVKEKSTFRRLINASNNLIARCLEQIDDPTTLLELAQEQIFDIGNGQVKSDFVGVREIMQSSFGNLDRMMESGSRVDGIATGFVDLDIMTSGFKPGELIIVAARPSLGKTAIALNIAARNAIKDGKKVGIFSLEMSREALMTRLMCAEAEVDSHKIRSGFAGREDWSRLTRALGRLSDSPLLINDGTALTIAQIRAKARRLKADKGLDLAIVDYLQLVAGGGRFENRTQEVSHISRGLKNMAKELKIPVVALSQLSRAPEQGGRIGRKPVLSDLRESGEIEQDADVVIFLFEPRRKRGEDEESEMDPRGIMMLLIVAKQRNGPTGEIPIVFLRPYTKFANYARRRSEDESRESEEWTPYKDE